MLTQETGREEEAAQPRDNYYDPMQYYPATNQFPPPPASVSPYPPEGPYQAPPIQNQEYNAYQRPYQQPAMYNPADYAAPAAQPIPPQQQYYPQQAQTPLPQQGYYPPQQPPQHGVGQNPENVSASPAPEHSEEGGCSRGDPSQR